MKIEIVFLVVIALVFSSCSSQKEKNISFEPKYPSWYLTPVSNDFIYLYGIGEGENLDEATKNALVSISSNLSVSITSNSTLKKESFFKYREYVSKQFLENINSNTQNLTFQNYEVINFHKQSYNKFLAQVRVKKSVLINSLKKEFALLDSEYIQALKMVEKKDFYSKYLEYIKLDDKQKTYIKKLQILKDLEPSYNDEKFYLKLKELNQKIEYSKSRVGFYILKEKIYPKISSKIKEYFTNEGFELYKNASYKIDIQSKVDSKNARGIFIVNNTITINILYNNKIVKSKVFKTEGVSSNSKEDAINLSYDLLTSIDLK